MHIFPKTTLPKSKSPSWITFYYKKNNNCTLSHSEYKSFTIVITKGREKFKKLVQSQYNILEVSQHTDSDSILPTLVFAMTLWLSLIERKQRSSIITSVNILFLLLKLLSSMPIPKPQEKSDPANYQPTSFNEQTIKSCAH